MGENKPVIKEVESSGIGLDSAQEYARLQTWLDNSTIMLLATRGMVDLRVWRAHDRLIWPMNQKRVKFDVVGMEVGEAYNALFDTALTHPTSKTWPWVLTYEEDNTPEPEAFVKLFKAITHCPDCKEPLAPAKPGGVAQFCSQGHRGLDGVAGLYWTKSTPPYPMAFGDPSEYSEKHRDFKTQNVLPYLEAEDELDQIIEVNAVPMGFTLYRKAIFEQMEPPWCVTADPEMTYSGENRGAIGQDIWLCMRAKDELGARFGVHCGVKVGHVDPGTGKVY